MSIFGAANPRGRGFTISEILVVMFLSMIIMVMLGQLFMPSVWMFQHEQSTIEVRHNVLVVLRRLTQSLTNTALETVTLATDPAPTASIPNMVSYIEVIGFGSSGAPIFGNRFDVFFFDRPGRRVMQRTWAPPVDQPTLTGSYTFGGITPPCLTATDLAQVCMHPDTARPNRVVARDIEAFVITDDDNKTTLLHPPLVISVNGSVPVSLASASDKPREEKWSLTTRVTPRSVR